MKAVDIRLEGDAVRRYVEEEDTVKSKGESNLPGCDNI